jgi:hypothetical protein
MCEFNPGLDILLVRAADLKVSVARCGEISTFGKIFCTKFVSIRTTV